jgi:hypothetical protein
MSQDVLAIAGERNTRAAQLLAQRSALGIELRIGMSLSRGRKMSTILKRHHGWKGDARKIYDQLNTLIVQTLGPDFDRPDPLHRSA